MKEHSLGGGIYLPTLKPYPRIPIIPEKQTIVAIKKLKKAQIAAGTNGIKYLLNEIKVHWTLEGCASVLKLLQLYEDELNVYMVLEYQPKGTLMTILEM